MRLDTSRITAWAIVDGRNIVAGPYPSRREAAENLHSMVEKSSSALERWAHDELWVRGFENWEIAGW